MSSVIRSPLCILLMQLRTINSVNQSHEWDETKKEEFEEMKIELEVEVNSRRGQVRVAL